MRCIRATIASSCPATTNNTRWCLLVWINGKSRQPASRTVYSVRRRFLLPNRNDIVCTPDIQHPLGHKVFYAIPHPVGFAVPGYHSELSRDVLRNNSTCGSATPARRSVRSQTQHDSAMASQIPLEHQLLYKHFLCSCRQHACMMMARPSSHVGP